ncbi:MAG TPA: sigma-70 family RNA polymerase sigma factor [Candidatus Binataceae bacterium]|nr:sigma-70 family RNA polymerase sigma factor [Candidatus Binataceae bacterium]
MAVKRDSGRSTRESFEREVMPHLDSIYSMALRLARNREDANDLLQDTILRAYRFFHQYTPGTNSRAWVLTILFNNFRNGYRKSGREQVSQSEDQFTERLEAESLAADQSRSDPESLAFADVMAPELTAALDALPEEFCVSLLLVDVEELSYREVSEVLSVPVGTVKSRVSRGRSLLRETLLNSVQRKGLKRA